MRLLGIVVLSIVVLAILVTVTYAAKESTPEAQAARALALDYQRQAQALALAEQERRAAQMDAFLAIAVPAAALTLAAVMFLALVGFAVWLAIALSRAYNRAQAERERARRDNRLVTADERGILPLDADGVLTGQYAALTAAGITGYHTARIEAAKVQQLPTNLHTYAPRQLTKTERATNATNAAALPAPPAGLALPGPVDLAQALTWRPTFDRLLLGLAPDGQPLVTDVRGLTHVALVGATGSGKSNAMRLLAGQLAAAGAALFLVDPHYTDVDAADTLSGDWRPIRARLAYPPAVTPRDMASVFGMLEHELDERLERRRAGKLPGSPWFLLCDEYMAVTRQVNGAQDVMTRILAEGRKVNVFTVMSTQSALVKDVGGSSAIRDCFRTALYGGGDVSSARALLDTRQVDDAPLGRGVVMLRNQSAAPQATLCRQPFVSNDSLYRLLSAPATNATNADVRGNSRQFVDVRGSEPGVIELQNGARNGSQSHERHEPATNYHERATNEPAPATNAPRTATNGALLTEQERDALNRLRAGQSISQVVKEVYGATGGEPFKRRSQELTALLLRYAPPAD